MHHFALCGTAPGILGTEGQRNFWAPWNFGGVNSTGQRLQQEGQGHSGGVVAKATACEDISYYNEKMLSQQTCLLA
ncbi:hypothetical protein A5774_01305 [Corynebacterium sp. EPI-003-04-2554_SCH2473622]|nr:hypothetical protein A5774_01305 [Corynebacterium sp. EPI-003-04-2554_SCH2473622]